MEWFFKIIVSLVLMVLTGVLYRLGGAAKSGKWYDFLCNTKARDFGVPTCLVAIFLAWRFPHHDLTDLSLILAWGACFGVQTTYWKKKGTDAAWYNWIFTGFGYSICWLPVVVAQNLPGHVPAGLHAQWLGFGIRTLICTTATMFVSEVFGDVVIEENARGWVEAITMPLLFIGWGS